MKILNSGVVAFFFLQGLLLLEYTRLLHFEWSSNEQYAHGYFVPILFLILLLRRWFDARPAQASLTGALRMFVIVGMLIGIFGALCIHFFKGANPDWRPLQWGLTFLFIALSLLYCALLGGAKWVKHFAFPMAILLFAVPWPTYLEVSLLQKLMGSVSFVIVKVFNLIGIYAEQSGSIIRLANGYVGVEEACSGIYSLQLACMLGYFFGEFYNAHFVRRCLIFLGGILVALAVNLARTFWLTLIFYREGEPGFAESHDSIGFYAMIAVVAGVWIVATVLSKEKGEDRPSTASAFSSNKATVLIQFACWIIYLAGILSIEWFYRSQSPLPTASLTFDRAAFPDSWKEETIPARSQAMLRYSTSLAGSWQVSSKKEISLFHLYWESGKISSIAGIHNPKECLRESGAKLTQEMANVRYKKRGGGSAIDFSFLEFRFGDEPIYILHAVWDDGLEEPIPTIRSLNDRFQLALNGQRIAGRQSLQLIARGFRNAENALQEMTSFLDQAISDEHE